MCCNQCCTHAEENVPEQRCDAKAPYAPTTWEENEKLQLEATAYLVKLGTDPDRPFGERLASLRAVLRVPDRF